MKEFFAQLYEKYQGDYALIENDFFEVYESNESTVMLFTSLYEEYGKLK